MSGEDPCTQRAILRDLAGFDDAYIDAMYAAEKAKCPACGKSLLAHAARFVSEACAR